MSSFFAYVVWHYVYAAPRLVRMNFEFSRHMLAFFSVGLFVKTLFRPLFNADIVVTQDSMVSDTISLAVSKMVMIIFGACLRFVFIVCGLVSAFITCGVMVGVLLVWVLLPALLCMAAFLSVALILV
jgi:hypothetical protein